MNNMKNVFSVKSPLWQIVAASLLYAVLVLVSIDSQAPDVRGMTAVRAGIISLAAIVFLYSILYSLALHRHNKRTPLDQLSVTGVKPAEIRDEDEGMQILTAKATLRVYRYHSFALPLAMAVIVLAGSSAIQTITILFAVILGHYVVYWHAIWPAFKESNDE